MGAWSALRSPRVVELFGVVREGPNVFLFMDHKSGKHFFPFTGTILTRMAAAVQLENEVESSWVTCGELSAKTCTVGVL